MACMENNASQKVSVKQNKERRIGQVCILHSVLVHETKTIFVWIVCVGEWRWFVM